MFWSNSFEGELVSFINAYYRDLLAKNDFSIDQKESGSGMGASITYAGHDIFILFINDRSSFDVFISSEKDRNIWWEIGFVLAYLELSAKNPFLRYRRKRILCDKYSRDKYSENSGMFSERLKTILQIFSPFIYDKTKVELEKTMKERLKYWEKIRGW